jgi:hypothetical protein
MSTYGSSTVNTFAGVRPKTIHGERDSRGNLWLNIGGKLRLLAKYVWYSHREKVIRERPSKEHPQGRDVTVIVGNTFKPGRNDERRAVREEQQLYRADQVQMWRKRHPGGRPMKNDCPERIQQLATRRARQRT